MGRPKQFDTEEVLYKAVKVFWRQGYNATSVEDLVNALGINRASLYDTFGDKQSLFNKAIESYQKKREKDVADVLNSETSVVEGLRKLLKLSVEESVEHPEVTGCFMVNTISELTPGQKDLQVSLNNNKEAFEEAFYRHLKKGEDSGEIPKGKDLKRLAKLIYTFYAGTMVFSKLEIDKEERYAQIDLFFEIFK